MMVQVRVFSSLGDHEDNVASQYPLDRYCATTTCDLKLEIVDSMIAIECQVPLVRLTWRHVEERYYRSTPLSVTIMLFLLLDFWWQYICTFIRKDGILDHVPRVSHCWMDLTRSKMHSAARKMATLSKHSC
jgi:hypothetical protein